MEISLAKPLNDNRKQAQMKREQRKQFEPPTHPRGSSSDNQRRGNHGGPPSGGFRNNSQRGNGGAMNRPDNSFSE